MIINCIRPFNRTISISSILLSMHSNVQTITRALNTQKASGEIEWEFRTANASMVFRLILIRIIENNLINTVTERFLRSVRSLVQVFLIVFACQPQFVVNLFFSPKVRSSVCGPAAVHRSHMPRPMHTIWMWNYYLRLVWINLAVESMHIELPIHHISVCARCTTAETSSRCPCFMQLRNTLL